VLFSPADHYGSCGLAPVPSFKMTCISTFLPMQTLLLGSMASRQVEAMQLGNSLRASR